MIYINKIIDNNKFSSIDNKIFISICFYLIIFFYMYNTTKKVNAIENYSLVFQNK